MKLPGAYKHRGCVVRMPPPSIVRIDCPGCDWRTIERFELAERQYRRHLMHVHDFPAVAPKQNPQ